jgi:hypothetical protein
MQFLFLIPSTAFTVVWRKIAEHFTVLIVVLTSIHALPQKCCIADGVVKETAVLHIIAHPADAPLMTGVP